MQSEAEAEIASFADIKKAGANTVRVVLSTGARYPEADASELASVMQVSILGGGLFRGRLLDRFRCTRDSATVEVYVEQSGVYELLVGYRAIYGEKTQQLSGNGARLGGVVFPAADDFQAVAIPEVELVAGVNRVSIVHDWGWFDLDYVEAWQVVPVRPGA